MSRIVSIALVLATAASCSSNDASGGGSGDVPQVVEFPFDDALGDQKPLAWSVSPFSTGFRNCWSLSSDDAILAVAIDKTAIVKYGHGASTDPPLWSTALPMPVCSMILATTDGGAVVVGQATPSDAQVTRFGGDGSVRWNVTIHGGFDFENASALLTSGDVALFVDIVPDAGSLDSPTIDLVIIGAADGKEKSRTHAPGTPRSDGVAAMAATPDGGLVMAGLSNGAVTRFDAAGKLSWSNQLAKEASPTDPPAFVTVAYLSDGSILATGYVGAGPIPDTPAFRFTQAVAIRYSGDGTLLWAKSFPFGKAPGVAFTEGLTTFDAIAPDTAGGASVVMHPASNGCRLLRLDASGAVTRVQILDPLGVTSGSTMGKCVARALGSDILYLTGTASVNNLAKITP